MTPLRPAALAGPGRAAEAKEHGELDDNHRYQAGTTGSDVKAWLRYPPDGVG
jgi:hypothetical protein